MCHSLVGKHGRGPARSQSMKAFSFVISTTLLFWTVAASAQLNVLISGGIMRIRAAVA